MGFKDFTVKLGNMRKAQEFTLYPQSAERPNEIILQSDKRIARVDLTTGKTMLSDGKGGHQGFAKLMPFLGAVEVDFPADELPKLVALVNGKPQVGPQLVCG